MRIETLYEFLLLTSNLNFTETAKSFFISQSVLSNHISGLEKELGIRLFVRDRHSVRLTQAGSLFLEDAQRIIAEYEHAIGRISQYRDGVSSVIRIGFLLGSYGSFLPLVCKRYSEQNPDVGFHFLTMEIGDIQARLNENRIDMGFTLFTKDIQGGKYAYRCLYADRYKLAVPKTHRLAARESITLADLEGETVLSPRFNRTRNTITQVGVMLRNAGIDVRTDDQIVDSGALMATIVATGHVAVTLDHHRVYGSGNVVFIPIESEGMDLCCGPIWKKSKETDAILSFVDFLLKETKGFTKEDFLSREGAEALPPL
ncbi:LysR family transcriptional regulator [Raoultibacter phocaeensis]|uniref:LysR substrate-binding domain-containing protein n=1 Tax=Raoultibacter phocaeensis TaxID=2479841 RepID=UPI0015D5D951|nr:LysR family transcriptional regulator [Raoultibacter phocaeensis]